MVAARQFEGFEGVAIQAHGQLAANGSPHPVPLFGGQVNRPGALHLFVGLVGVAAGQLHQSQHHQLLHRIARMCIVLVQKLGRLGLQVFQGVQQLGGHQLHRIASGHRPVVLHSQARFAPHLQRFDFAVFQQALCGQRTAIIGLQH